MSLRRRPGNKSHASQQETLLTYLITVSDWIYSRCSLLNVYQC